MKTGMKLLLLGAAGLAAWYVPTILALLQMEVSIISAYPNNIRENFVDAIVTVKLKNKSGVRVNMQSIKADIIFNGLKVAEFSQLESFPILAHSEQNLNVGFTLDAAQLGNELWLQLLSQNLQNFVIDVRGSLVANNKTLPFDAVWTIQDFAAGNGSSKAASIGAVKKYTQAQEKFIFLLGDKEWELVEPFGSLWKARGKKIYVRNTKNDRGAFEYLKRQRFIKYVTEAGGDDVLYVELV